jgi:hypothetical protein
VYLATEKHFAVSDVEIPVQIVLEPSFTRVGGRFDAIINMTAEEAMKMMALPNVVGVPTAGRWVLDYKTTAALATFDADAYFYGPSGRIYELHGKAMGCDGIVYVAISKEHPAGVEFHFKPFESDLDKIRGAVGDFYDRAAYVSRLQNRTQKDFRDCYSYGKVCPLYRSCFGGNE